MKRLICIFIFYFICSTFSHLRSQILQGITVNATILDDDTIAYISLPTVKVFAPKIFTSPKQKKQWSKLVRNVKKVYPYAVIASNRMHEYEKLLSAVKSEKEKKRLMKEAEDDIKREFEKDIRNMTFSQGKILIKLIDRETGNTSYQLVKDFRGTLPAFFWQSVARVFGANLKDDFDAEGEDKMIEEIVNMIECGDL